MNNKVSVIVPIYNSEKTLDYCLNSIISQTYKNLEIILVNDGSNDNSINIISKYQEKDSRIIIINKENSGVADTRNKGIDKATGKYIMFVDSDDIIIDNYIEELMNTLISNKSDIVVSSMTIRNKNKDTYISLNKDLKNISRKDIIDEIINTINFSSSCKTLFKKSILNDLRFNTELKYGEDMLFEYNLLGKGKISYIDNHGYIYIQNKESMMNKNTYKYVQKYLNDSIYVLDQILIDNLDKKELIDNKKIAKMNLALSKLTTNKELKYKEYKQIIKEFIQSYKIKNISNESKINKIRLHLLKNKHYYMYYVLNKIINFIKRK